MEMDQKIILSACPECYCGEIRQTNPRAVFRFMTLVSAISSTKQIILSFALFFYLPQFSSYRNHLHRDLNLGQIFRVVAFVPVISSQKQTTLVLVPFFCHA
jgi:hypothetical protein